MSDFRLFQFTQVLIYAIALLGLNMLTGYNGQISLGHGAFYAIGAYTTAIMIDKWDIAYGWTIPVAGIVCLVVGFLFGRPALRLEGLYLALATFALALAVPQILKYFEHWTGGSQGIVLSKPKAPFGLRLIRGPVAVLRHPGAWPSYSSPSPGTSCAGAAGGPSWRSATTTSPPRRWGSTTHSTSRPCSA